MKLKLEFDQETLIVECKAYSFEDYKALARGWAAYASTTDIAHDWQDWRLEEVLEKALAMYITKFPRRVKCIDPDQEPDWE